MSISCHHPNKNLPFSFLSPRLAKTRRLLAQRYEKGELEARGKTGLTTAWERGGGRRGEGQGGGRGKRQRGGEGGRAKGGKEARGEKRRAEFALDPTLTT